MISPTLRFAIPILIAAALTACESSPIELEDRAESGVQAAVVPTATRIFAGGTIACGTLADGQGFCWGESSTGSIGIAATWAEVPRPMRGTLRFSFVAPGDTHSCGIDETGRAWCWGTNQYGQLGNNTDITPNGFARVKTSLTFVSIAVGKDFSCGAAVNGRVYCWGRNALGQLGVGVADASRLAPTRIALGGTDYVAVAAGEAHACAMRAGGKVYCWGRNHFGQLGRGYASTHEPTPAGVFGRAMSSLRAGGNTVCGIAIVGGAYCWGQIPNLHVPTRVTNGATFTSISVGSTHACALNGAGTPYCWGDNLLGQTGTGWDNPMTIPTLVFGAPTLASIAAGGTGTCGMRADGSALCWGTHILGAGLSRSTIPVEVLPPF